MEQNLKQAVLHKVMENLPEASENKAAELVDRAEEYFLLRTKRKTVPTSAFYLWIDLSLRMHQLGGSSEDKVTSIKRGDTTVQYSDADSVKDVADLESRILGYRVVRLR